MATIIHVDGTEEELTNTSLKSLQKAVGGYIEIHRIDSNRQMVMDEEGKLKDKPINERATVIMSPRGIGYIVGDVVVMEGQKWK